MPFSIWEYLRGRTRDAVLAGFLDALDCVEGDDIDGAQHEQANRLVSRLRSSGAALAEPGATPALPANDRAGSAVLVRASATIQGPPDDEIQNRLGAAAAQNGHPTPPAQGKSARKRRGRPPKKDQAKP